MAGLTVLDAIRRIGQFQKELVNNMPSISRDVAGIFLVAKIEQIRKRGVGQYNKNKYGAGLLKGKELNSAGKSFLDAKIKKRESTNWQELRAAQGLQINFVDLYYSGQMLNSTGIQMNNSVSYRYYSIIGGRNDEAKKKMFLNMKRYGRFLDPTPDQVLLMANRALKLIGDIFKRILLT